MFWLLVITAFALLVFRSFKSLNYWKERNVKQGSPVPIFGDLFFTTFRFSTFLDDIKNFYNRYPNERYTGIYFMMEPTLVIRDPDLIKQITIKDFHHFEDHRRFLPDDSDPLWSRNLFFLRGEPWHVMRSTLSPAFTSSKMKLMFTLVNECAEQYTNYFLKQDSDVTEVELKETFSRCTNDVIATCAFGLKCDSLKDKSNEFYLKGSEVSNFETLQKRLCILTNMFSPRLCKLLGLRIISESAADFFIKIITDTIKVREEQNIYRPDMLNLLMEARKGKLKHEEEDNHHDGFASVQESHIGKAGNGKGSELTDIDMAAQAVIFFVAGFETASTVLSFAAYEITVNPDVQEKLRNEIDEAFTACKGKITYDTVTKLNYLDMVISEALRKWPAPVATDRLCVKPYTIQPTRPREKPVHIKVDDIILIPTVAIHNDPNYYPNPDKFDPERFSEDNKRNLTPDTYLPFGMGPRNCIGSRFALMELKTVIFHLLLSFEFTVIEKTDIPMKIKKGAFITTSENGMWIGLKKRQKSKRIYNFMNSS